MDLNRWFDRVPRLTIIVGPRELPAFRSIGYVGFHAATLAALLTGAIGTVPIVHVLGICCAAGLSFFAWALLRRLITGVESLVLFEHLWVAMAAVALLMWGVDVSVRRGLDVLSVGICVFFAVGRLGCLTVGCCHGTPVRTGVRYGPDHRHLPNRLIGRRLRPVQLYEAVGLAAIGVVALVLAGGTPGAATLWWLVAYSVLRFGTDALRGDVLPYVGRISQPRLMAVVQVAGAVVLSEVWFAASRFDQPFWISASLLFVVLIASIIVICRRPFDPLTTHKHLDEAWSLIEQAADAGPGEGANPVLRSTAQGLSVGVSIVGQGVHHVSLSHRSRDVAGVARCLTTDGVTERDGIAHFIRYLATEPGDDARFGAEPDDDPRQDRSIADHVVDDYFAPPISTPTSTIVAPVRHEPNEPSAYEKSNTDRMTIEN